MASDVSVRIFGMPPRKVKPVCEFGDFQTPEALAVRAMAVLQRMGMAPGSVLEPTCGRGAFVLAARKAFPSVPVLGGDINRDHLDELDRCLSAIGGGERGVQLRHADFFQTDWGAEVARLPEPVLIAGNYPWVTNAALGALGSANLPGKSNFHGYVGLDALMGKSNFDISEWMLLRNLDWLSGRTGVIAMLCKVAVARKILIHAWKADLPIRRASLHTIDAMKHFGAAVDACFFVLELAPGGNSRECAFYSNLEDDEPSGMFGYHDGLVVSDVGRYVRHRSLRGTDSRCVWRSGIKHDCSKVMELTLADSVLVNGYGATVSIEDRFLYPLLKSSDLGGKRKRERQMRMLVPQKSIGESTSGIANVAPKTWAYLRENAAALSARGSSIYKGKPEFSIFGVGDYSFAFWKIAISGFYRGFDFRVIGPQNGKPVVFDDTVYFLPCGSEQEARFLYRLLMAKETQEFLESMVFWHDKRPITVELLKRVDLRMAARQLGLESTYLELTAHRSKASQGTLLLSNAAE